MDHKKIVLFNLLNQPFIDMFNSNNFLIIYFNVYIPFLFIKVEVFFDRGLKPKVVKLGREDDLVDVLSHPTSGSKTSSGWLYLWVKMNMKGTLFIPIFPF